MAVISEWQQCFDNNKNIYDFISSCFSVLDSHLIDKTQRTNFVKDVNDETGIFKLIREKVEKDYLNLFSYTEQINYFRSIVIDHMDMDITGQLSLMYSFLLGINTALKSRKDSSFNIWGPLDTNDSNVYRLYLRPNTTYLDSFIAGVGKERNIDKDHLLASLDRFIFVKSTEFGLANNDCLPKGILVETRQDNWDNGIIRIGISPLCYRKNFDFVPPSAQDPKVQFFTVNYPSTIDQKDFTDIVNQVLEDAIDKRCNIVVFPEYICSNQIKETISSSLKSLSKESQFVPDLVFAGTNWNQNNENELFVFNRYGEEIGRYHKRIRFDSKLKDGIEWIENLNSGWNNNSFFCLPEIGYIMPAICKDALVCDGPSDLFSKHFSPLLIVVPAWSKSINSFVRLGNSTIDNFTSFVVADACSAVCEKKDRTLGKGYIVTKDKTVVGKQEVNIVNKNCNFSNCKKGCLLVAKYDFNYESGVSEEDEPISNTHVEQLYKELN